MKDISETIEKMRRTLDARGGMVWREDLGQLFSWAEDELAAAEWEGCPDKVEVGELRRSAFLRSIASNIFTILIYLLLTRVLDEVWK